MFVNGKHIYFAEFKAKNTNATVEQILNLNQ